MIDTINPGQEKSYNEIQIPFGVVNITVDGNLNVEVLWDTGKCTGYSISFIRYNGDFKIKNNQAVIVTVRINE